MWSEDREGCPGDEEEDDEGETVEEEEVWLVRTADNVPEVKKETISVFPSYYLIHTHTHTRL